MKKTVFAGSKKEINGVCFLTIGKTQESKEASEGFKRYVGLASSYVLAVCPKKAELDELMGFESQSEPEYVKEDEQGKQAIVTFIVKTDADSNNGIEIVNRATIILRPQPAYNKDQTKVQVIDQYGNFTWADTEVAKAGGKIEHATKLDKYRMACVGECALVDFLKKYLGVPDAYDYKNGVWVKKENGKSEEGIFGLERIKDYFKGDFSELREALALQPNNKIKLLYGVKTSEDGKEYQAVCMRDRFILRSSANETAIAKMDADLQDAYNRGSFSNITYKVQPLAEYEVEPTDLSSAPSGNKGSEDSDALPWD
jgi:hypothetical protein